MDLISRQAAIDALGEKPLAWTEGEYELGLQNQWQSDVDALNGLPSAQPERKKGKWDFMGWQMFQCSECKHTFTQDFLEGWRGYTYEPFFPPFCPNCGADMRGEQNAIRSKHETD